MAFIFSRKANLFSEFEALPLHVPPTFFMRLTLNWYIYVRFTGHLRPGLTMERLYVTYAPKYLLSIEYSIRIQSNVKTNWKMIPRKKCPGGHFVLDSWRVEGNTQFRSSRIFSRLSIRAFKSLTSRRVRKHVWMAK